MNKIIRLRSRSGTGLKSTLRARQSESRAADRIYDTAECAGESGKGNSMKTGNRSFDLAQDRLPATGNSSKAKVFGFTLCAMLLALCVSAAAQQPAKVLRIGYLINAPFSASPQLQDAFRQGLRDLGYAEGNNIIIEWRSSERSRDRQRALAAELVRIKVDVIVAVGSGDIRAAKEATAKIPIVMIQGGDGSGFVNSLARPGGNITGLATLRPELSGKRLEILKEVVPKLSRVAIFASSGSADYGLELKEIEIDAGPLGLKLQSFDIRSLKDLKVPSKPQLRAALTRFFSGCRAPSSIRSEERLSNSRQRAGCQRYTKGQKKSKPGGSCPTAPILTTCTAARRLMSTKFSKAPSRQNCPWSSRPSSSSPSI